MNNMSLVERNGIWSISCVQHGFLEAASEYFTVSYDYKVPGEKGSTINAALM